MKKEEKMKAKRKILHALISKGMMWQAKPYLLESYGVTTTLDLPEEALDELIARMRAIVDQSTPPDTAIRKIRHRCLKLMAEIGINTQDWECVNQFMLNPHVCGRMMYELNEEELIAFRRKLYAIRDEIERRKIIKQEAAMKEQRLASLN